MNSILTKKSHFYLLFLLSPLLSLITSLRHRNNGVYKNIVWLFVAFYGFNITFPEGETNLDGIRRVATFEVIASESNYNFENFERDFDSEENTQVDVFEPFIVYWLSRITDDARVLMLLYGLLFGFFYSRNLSYLLDKVHKEQQWKVLFLLITFAFLNPFWNIGGFRYWFATQLFIYGLLPYLYNGHKKKLIWLFLTPFVHFSYIFAVAIFLGYYFLGNRLKAYFYYFLACLLIGNIEIESFKSLLSFIPSTKIQMKGDSYINEQYIETVDALENMSQNWYVTFTDLFIHWFVIVTIIFCFFRFRAQIETKYATMFSFILVYLGTSFLFASVPSMPRFNTVGFILFFFFLTLFTTEKYYLPLLDRYLSLAKWGLLVCIVVNLRIAFDTVSFICLFANPLIAPFLNSDNFSIIDFFK